MPATKCKLRLLKLDRVKDYLLMEEEFVAGQERLKPQEDKNEEDQSKVDDLRSASLDSSFFLLLLHHARYGDGCESKRGGL
jgi:hypothetical protein